MLFCRVPHIGTFGLMCPKIFLKTVHPEKFSLSRSSKGSSLHQTTSFELSSVQIGRRVRAMDDIKKKDTKAENSPYWEDKTPEAITMNFLPHKMLEWSSIVPNFVFDQSRSFHPVDH
jgi:hypothetical protein